MIENSIRSSGTRQVADPHIMMLPTPFLFGARCQRSACRRGHRDGERCDTTAEFDMLTMIWTRGEAMALDLLPERLRCPICGNRKIQDWSGRTMLARARGKIGAKIPPRKSTTDFIAKSG